MLLITHLTTKLNERLTPYRVPTETVASHIRFEGNYSTIFSLPNGQDLELKNRSIISIDHNI